MQTSRRTEARSRNQGGDPMVRDVSAEHLGTALRRRWWAPLVGLILGLGIALGLAASEPPQYESVTTMMVHAGADDDTAAERLAAEEGWYENDPEGRLGQLDAALFRARRLVADTGLHAMRWTRQQAIDYGIPPSEVDRYVVMPGQATSYMIGQLEIVRLRDKARDALGERFDPREFHNRVLLTGVVPLELLEREVDDYIAKAAAR